MKVRFLPFFCLAISLSATAQLQSPEQFFGYKLGERFTPHHRVMDYYDHLVETLPNVTSVGYGETYEYRELRVVFLSSQANMDNLEQIRQDNLRRAGLQEGTPSTNIPIVWLSYNVHGNESVSTEASMATIYELVRLGSDKTEWLDKVVVAIDPCINPDGRDRYVNFYHQYGNKDYNPDPSSREHVEPWPRGRANHYLFDLNRDWAWQSQVESQGRIELYNQWLPQVHVDFHEQGVNSPYYFAPAAEPYHELITDWQREFQVLLGKNHAKYFDQNGWLYFTKQVFDLLYPSYGDTYPMYSGAIGMTYEQGGSGRAGLGVLTEIGDTLTLADRLAHHYTTGLSTIEVSVNNSDRLMNEFTEYYNRATTQPSGKYKAFVIKGTNHHRKLKDLKRWLDTHQIQYGSSSAKTLRGFNYQTGLNTSFSLSSDDIVVSAYQPKSVMAHVLFEPNPKLSDSLTYDITAWAIPYAYDLEAYATETNVSITSESTTPEFQELSVDAKPYGYLSGWSNLIDVRFLSKILRAGVRVRFSEKPFTIQGKRYTPGSLVIPRRGNEHLGSNFDQIVIDAANSLEKRVTPVLTGFVENGVDLGSNDIHRLKAPKVALLQGDGVSSLAFGETWHYFERQIDYPVSVLGMDYIDNVNLDKYDVLIIQNGNYNSFSEDSFEKIKSWVKEGGRLILVQGGLDLAAGKDGFSLMRADDITPDPENMTYAERDRINMSEIVPGAIFEAAIDGTHPLGFGFPNKYFTLKNSDDLYQPLGDGWNVSTIRKGDPVSGFAGKKIRANAENSLLLGTERMGSGQVIYMVDNPLFRAFWYNGKMMFSNAVFMSGKISRR